MPMSAACSSAMGGARTNSSPPWEAPAPARFRDVSPLGLKAATSSFAGPAVSLSKAPMLSAGLGTPSLEQPVHTHRPVAPLSSIARSCPEPETLAKVGRVTPHAAQILKAGLKSSVGGAHGVTRPTITLAFLARIG